MKLKLFVSIVSLMLCVCYYLAIQVNINYNHEYTSNNYFTFSVDSNKYFTNNIDLRIAAIKSNQESLGNGYPINHHRYKINPICDNSHNLFSLSEQLSFKLLKQGVIHCKVYVKNHTNKYKPIVKRKITLTNYILLWILGGIPLVYFIFLMFLCFLNYIKQKINIIKKEDIDMSLTRKKHNVLWIMFLGGVLIRVLYSVRFYITEFQHDINEHYEYIQFIKDNWVFPISSHGWEFPQQPLYYWITGFITMGVNNYSILILTIFSLICSIVFLYYICKLSLLIANKIIQFTLMIFIAFTPSMVYMTGRINNDVLVIALSSFAIYYIIKSYKHDFKKFFYIALTGTTLLFLTKVSSAPIEIFFFLLLSYSYLYQSNNLLKKHIFLFILVGFTVLVFTLFKVYLPIEQIFGFVNSGAFGNQLIDIKLSYFMTFNIVELLHTAQSYVYSGIADITNSLFTYQYGTMLFGEFDYYQWTSQHIYLQYIMQSIIILGLIYLVGLFIYIVNFFKLSFLEKNILVTVSISFILIIYFFTTYPSICNTDFRYFSSVFILIAFIFGKGLSYISFNKYMTYLIYCILGLLVFMEVSFFTILFMS